MGNRPRLHREIADEGTVAYRSPISPVSCSMFWRSPLCKGNTVLVLRQPGFKRLQ